MTATGFYSVVQFCRDEYRLEGVNIGVVLAVPERGVFVRFAERNEQVKRVFTSRAYDDTRLTAAKRALENRLLRLIPATRAALVETIGLEPGPLRILEPLPVLADDPDVVIGGLFADFVEDPLPASRRRPKGPELSLYFEPLRREGIPIEPNPHVSIPVIREPFKADYGYKNGQRNLIKSVAFDNVSSEKAISSALELGSKGLLLAKHDDEKHGGTSRLIVVARFDEYPSAVETVLIDHGVVTYAPSTLSELVQRVRADAHS